MKRSLIYFVSLIIILFLFGFVQKYKSSKSHLHSSYRHFTCAGDINFDLTDTVNVQFFRMTIQGIKSLGLVGTYTTKDSFINPLSITLIGVNQKGSYGLDLTDKAGAAMITYAIDNKNKPDESNIFMSLQADDGSGFVKIDSLSDEYISGNYRTSIANQSGIVYNIHGVFSGALTSLITK